VANQKGYDGVHTAIFAREKYWQIVTTTSEFELKIHKKRLATESAEGAYSAPPDKTWTELGHIL